MTTTLAIAICITEAGLIGLAIRRDLETMRQADRQRRRDVDAAADDAARGGASTEWRSRQ